MINAAKIEVFKKYSGDSDGWARMASAGEKAIISGNEWYEINALIQDYALVKKGLASQRFSDKLDIRINEMVDSPEDFAILKDLIMQYA